MEPRDAETDGQAELQGVRYLAAAIVDAQGNVREWTPGAERLLGFGRDEMAGRPIAALLDPEVPADVRQRMLEGAGGTSTVVMRHRDGHPITVELISTPRPDADGAPVRLLVASGLPIERDVAETLKSWALDQVPFIGAIFDTEAHYVHLNDYARRLWKIPADRLLGRTVEEDSTEEGTGEFQESILQSLRTGEPSIYEATQRRGYRTQAWAIHNTPLKDAAGQVRGLYTLGIDTSREFEARARLNLLNRASATIGSTLDVRTTAMELTQIVVPELADFVTVDVLDSVLAEEEPLRVPESPALVRRLAENSVLRGVPESVLKPGDTEIYIASSPNARALASGEAYITKIVGDPDIDQWAGLPEERYAKGKLFGFHSGMVVPLRARGSTFGVVCFYRHRRPDDFTPDDMLLAEEISTRAAVCVDNAQRYARQRATALTLQHSLLPHDVPRHTAVDIASRYLPSDVRGGVGGDWFDVIPLSGARVALVVGDVVGHGIQASATMGRLRTAVRTLADIEMPPDELLTQLDGLIDRPFATASERQPESDAGATCLYAVYDPVTRWLAVSRAGHPPPVLVLPDGSVDVVDVPAGPPLGLGGLPFERAEVRLPEGSLLALYTDGLIASRERDIDQGIAELQRQLAGPKASLEETCDRVLAGLQRETPADDVALLLARTRAMDSSQTVTWELPADPEAVATAREHASQELEEWGLDEVTFTTELVVSELVTNAIRHASGPINLRLILEETTLICEVSDGSDTFPRLRRARAYDEGGRGLLLVAQLSRRWGTRSTANGKVIWADQPVTPPHRET
ncbi:PAS domain S-box-containing protein [Streptomyces sp. DvalAA-14]|uniref:SpoIIE family protein phosphatase n=1 Tax=unclassified Streptomyces TaxID=2593676 RepID=UPI00081B24A0|nr:MULTISPECIES: SpoIIE family protein phosphatase [unclassified Streptomyces]MYS18869.1 SpoIIE family protein phosphatase [Streptomyces sp. SID4948]SCD30823.1 PAS domain S-box-containing protein [Streptomyces sp. DvalAA-14]